MPVPRPIEHTHRHEELMPVTKRKRNPRPELKIVADYMMIDGELKEIDPFNTPGLPERCMLVIAEIMTGCKCEIVDKKITGVQSNAVSGETF